MKRMKTKFLFALSAMSFCLVSCGGGEAGPQGDPQILEVYRAYQENGGELTYSEWLESVKGDKGDKGDQGDKGDKGDQGDPGRDGQDGENGKDGRSVTQIMKTSSEGNVDTYLIVYSDGTTSTFTVTNGAKGEQGIQGEKGEDGHAPIITIGENGNWFIDGVDTGLPSRGEQGPKGDKGDDANHAGEKHTVTFDANGGSMPAGFATSIEVLYGDYFTLPVPTLENHSFLGWYTGTGPNDGKFTSLTPVVTDLTLIALWESNAAHTLFFETNGGNAIDPQTYYLSETITELPTPARADYSFLGWCLDEELTHPVSLPMNLTENRMIYAKWTKATYTVSYHFQDGGASKTPTLHLAGSSIDAISAPDITGKQFVNWYYNSGFTKAVSFPLEIHSDLELYAKYADAKYSINLVTNGGSFVEGSVKTSNLVYGETITGLPEIYKDNYEFNGWYTTSSYASSSKVSFPYTVNGNATFYAKWTYVNPYRNFVKIYNTLDFQQITDLSKNYVLMADLDFEGATLNQVGSSAKPFTGIFDGNGYAIKSFTLTSTTDNGLFYQNEGAIRNLALNYSHGFTANKANSGGGLAFRNVGQITNCRLDITDTATTTYYTSGSSNDYIGGVTAYNSGLISDCEVYGYLRSPATSNSSGKFSVGGIAGHNTGNITRCINHACLYSAGSGSNNKVGGIAGSNSSTIDHCLVLSSYEGVSGSTTKSIANSESTAVEENNYKANYIVLDGGASVNVSTLNTSSFYSGSSYLGLSTSLWDLSNLNFDNGQYAHLRLRNLLAA